MSRSEQQQLETGQALQGGGVVTSSRYRQQTSLGGGIANSRLSSPRFSLIPGMLGASFSSPKPTPVGDLDLKSLLVKDGPGGADLPLQAWQTDNTPFFVWEPPASGLEIAGYSYAFDGVPDNTVDTTSMSLNIATHSPPFLSDGKRTFSVQVINTAGNAGKPSTAELWIDTLPPHITTTSPSPGGMVNLSDPAVSAVLSDAGSGVDASAITALLNGRPLTVTFSEITGVMTATGSGMGQEGSNSVELRVADAVGNAQTPLVWSFTIDATPPQGTVTINGGAGMTTSLYVTLSLSASDEVSGPAKVLISNDPLTGYVEEPYVAQRQMWGLNPVRGVQTVYVKFVDGAGNVSEPVSDAIELGLLAPDTVITSGPAGATPNRTASFSYRCPEQDCMFSYALDRESWSAWASEAAITRQDLPYGNHYFRVKAAREVNGVPGIQPDEEDPSPAERTWVVGVESTLFVLPREHPIKLWRIE